MFPDWGIQRVTMEYGDNTLNNCATWPGLIHHILRGYIKYFMLAGSLSACAKGCILMKVTTKIPRNCGASWVCANWLCIVCNNQNDQKFKTSETEDTYLAGVFKKSKK